MNASLRYKTVVAVVYPRTDTTPRRHAPGPSLIVALLVAVEGRSRFASDRVPIMSRRQQVGDLPFISPVEVLVLVVSSFIFGPFALESRSDLLQSVLRNLLLKPTTDASELSLPLLAARMADLVLVGLASLEPDARR